MLADINRITEPLRTTLELTQKISGSIHPLQGVPKFHNPFGDLVKPLPIGVNNPFNSLSNNLPLGIDLAIPRATLGVISSFNAAQRIVDMQKLSHTAQSLSIACNLQGAVVGDVSRRMAEIGSMFAEINKKGALTSVLVDVPAMMRRYLDSDEIMEGDEILEDSLEEIVSSTNEFFEQAYSDINNLQDIFVEFYTRLKNLYEDNQFLLYLLDKLVPLIWIIVTQSIGWNDEPKVINNYNTTNVYLAAPIVKIIGINSKPIEVRKAPRNDYKAFVTLAAGTEFSIEKSTLKWAYVTFNSKEGTECGWVRKAELNE